MDETRIFQNKERFISLLRTIKRPNAHIEELIEKLETSDFFIAPASTKYHGSVKGGLCAHCLCVYDNLLTLVTSKHLDINPDSLIIVSLLHDFSKMNYYELYFQNKKIYSPNGSKYDENGKYDWVSVSAYKVKDVENRFIFGSHEETAEYMARCYIPLTYDESVAILHHMGQLSSDSAKDNLFEIFVRSPLTLLLHIADLIAASLDLDYCINE